MKYRGQARQAVGNSGRPRVLGKEMRPIHALAPAFLLAAVLLLGLGPNAGAAEPRQPTTMLGKGREVAAHEVLVRFKGEPAERSVRLDPDLDLREALRDLRSRPDVRWATPNAIAHAAWIPRDHGRHGGRGGWQQDQWNFLAPPPVGTACTGSSPCGINAPRAWSLLRRAGHPEGRRRNGRRGPIVAVVDTGVAYRNRGKHFRRSPELARGLFVPGKDYVGHNKVPLDHNGHGTHVASTIAEKTDNRRSVTGLADGLRLMPVRVLNASGAGSAKNVARGIRFATRNGAKVINLSLEFGPGFDGCNGLRGVCHAIRKARHAGIVVVAANGNAGASTAQMPAQVSFGVASSTIRGCLSDFSSRGPGTDITAPGGGPDADRAEAGTQCRPFAPGPSIVQLTLRPGPVFRGNFRHFGYPEYEGTSMATPHVSAAAGLVIASRVLAHKLGRRPAPREVERWLKCTARPVQDPSKAALYGAGLLDLAAALNPSSSCPALGV